MNLRYSAPLWLCVIASLLLIDSLSLRGQVVTNREAAPPGVTPDEGVIYKRVDGRELHAYISKPASWKATDRRPAVIFFHGGGWVGGSTNQFLDQARRLASRGAVCVRIQYRLADKVNSNTPPIMCVQDAKSGMRWVRAHAAELGVDPNRIAAAGGSAGGQLAAFVGLVAGLDGPGDDLSVSPKPQAMILFNPLFDNGPGGWGHQRVGDQWREYSPFHHVSSNAPPALVITGDVDELIPLEKTKAFQKAMQAAGVRCELRIYEGQDHGFFNKSEFKAATLKDAEEFLVSIGWLAAEKAAD